MRFSIIIPAYNAELTISNALNSLLHQTFNDFEVLILNDGSNDETESVCKSTIGTDFRFKYFSHKNNGVSYTRNKGLDLASGEYVLFLDSDDKYASDYLAVFNEAIEKFPEFDCFLCGYVTVDKNGNERTTNVFETNEEFLNKERSSDIMQLREMVLDSQLWNKAFKKELIDRFSIRMYDDLSLGEDTLFNYEYLDRSNGKIIVINKALYYYNLANENSLDSKFRNDLKEIFEKIDNHLFEYFTKWNISEQDMKKYYNSVYYRQLKVLRNTFYPQNRLTKKEKYKFNQEILKSEKFKSSILNSDCYIHPLYKFAYKINSWRFVQIIDNVIEFIHH